MNSTPFSPHYARNRRYVLCYHPVCTHLLWRERATPIPADTLPDAIPAPPLHVLRGTKFCPACTHAQKHPSLEVSRLIGSVWAQRITAIGFGIGRKGDLQAQHFTWDAHKEVWVFVSSPGEIKKDLAFLAEALGCVTEMVDVRVAPPMPSVDKDMDPQTSPAPPMPEALGCATEMVDVSVAPAIPAMDRDMVDPEASPVTPAPEVSSALVQDKPPTWAVITCAVTGSSVGLSLEAQKTRPVIGSIPWPPCLENLPEVSSAGLPPEVPRYLCLSGIAKLAKANFTQRDLWRLAQEATALNVAICTVDLKFDTRRLLSGIQQLPPGSCSAEPMTSPTKSKGGRPASARAKQNEVIELDTNGFSAASISRKLGISSRSVRRIIERSTGLPITADSVTQSC